MAEANGNYDKEKRFDRMDGMIGGLWEHAALTDKRIEALHQAQPQTNGSVQGLVAAIRDLIDRIPSENLR